MTTTNYPECEWPESVLEDGNWSFKERHWRAPVIDDDEEVIFNEPGRVLRSDRNSKPFGSHIDVCCRSHYFLVTKSQHGRYYLHVEHGGGHESWKLDYDKRTIAALGALDSDHRYKLLWVIMTAHHDSYRAGAEAATKQYRDAFVKGKLKKRKMPGRDQHKVWIE